MPVDNHIVSWFNIVMAVRETNQHDAFKAYVERCGGQKAAALKLGCSPQFVGQLFHGHKRVPDAMLGKIGLRRSVVAVK